MRNLLSLFALSMVAVLLGTSSAYAQVCERVRDTTAAERQTMTSVLESVLAALPIAPEGWVITGYEGISVVQNLCLDAESTPEYGISRTYNRVDDAAEQERLQAEASVALRASMAERQPRIDALMAKNQELAAQLGPAAESGDQARIDAIYRELEELQRQMEIVMSEGPSPEQLAAIGGAMMHDRIITIAVRINPRTVSTSTLQSAAAPTGAQSAFRGQETREGYTEGRAVVLLGSWQPRANGDMETVQPDTLSPAITHGVAVTVTADPARLDTMLAAINFAALAALVH